MPKGGTEMAIKHGENMEKKPQRDAKGRFIAGHSASGVGGRPKQDPEAKEILRAATPKAAQALVDLLQSKREAVRLEAAKEILNRTQGKPETMNKVELSNADNKAFLLQWITTETDETSKS